MPIRNAKKPSYCKIRNFLGEKDLVVSLYSQECQFKCKFCVLYRNSSITPVSANDQKSQIDFIFKKFKNKLNEIERISIGNESSIFDESRTPFKVLRYLAERCTGLKRLKTISFETRPEFITSSRLERVVSLFGKEIDLTVGYETQSEKLRRKIGKNLSEKTMLKAIDAIAKNNCSLTSYVLFKPDLSMTERDSIIEALKTIEHLNNLTSIRGVPLVIYLNPIYIPKNSSLSIETKKNNYSPPLACSLVRVITESLKKHPSLPIYIGLYSENLAMSSGDFFCPQGFNSLIREQLKKFNQSQEPAIFKKIKCNKCGYFVKAQ